MKLFSVVFAFVAYVLAKKGPGPKFRENGPGDYRPPAPGYGNGPEYSSYEEPSKGLYNKRPGYSSYGRSSSYSSYEQPRYDKSGYSSLYEKEASYGNRKIYESTSDSSSYEKASNYVDPYEKPSNYVDPYEKPSSYVDYTCKECKDGEPGPACFLSDWYCSPYPGPVRERPIGGPYSWASSVARNTDPQGRVGSAPDGMGCLDASRKDDPSLSDYGFGWVNGKDYCFPSGPTPSFADQFWEQNYDPPVRVVAVTTQGRELGTKGTAQWVKTYKVVLTLADGTTKTFHDLPGNTDTDTKVTNFLENQNALVRRLRIFPLTYQSFPSLRMAVKVLLCNDDPDYKEAFKEIVSQNQHDNPSRPGVLPPYSNASPPHTPACSYAYSGNPNGCSCTDPLP